MQKNRCQAVACWCLRRVAPLNDWNGLASLQLQSRSHLSLRVARSHFTLWPPVDVGVAAAHCTMLHHIFYHAHERVLWITERKNRCTGHILRHNGLPFIVGSMYGWQKSSGKKKISDIWRRWVEGHTKKWKGSPSQRTVWDGEEPSKQPNSTIHRMHRSSQRSHTSAKENMRWIRSYTDSRSGLWIQTTSKI